ncbi:MAG: RNA-binding protein [Candidatus Marinimicrobia bacterium]|nr:RNA-binding protein [Candidatus Neomarinimicrobiota bacterium]
MNVYVSNLSHADISADLRTAFESHGKVASVTIITDEFDGKKRGFGIIEMPDETEASAAIRALNGSEVGGHLLKLSDRRNAPRRSGVSRRNPAKRTKPSDRRNGDRRK